MLFERSATPCVTADDARAFVESLLSTMRPTHAEYGLVLDMRRVRGNNSAEFEDVLVSALKVAMHGYARIVVVVDSMSGMLQVIRMERRLGRDDEFVTNNLQHAIAVAAGEVAI